MTLKKEKVAKSFHSNYILFLKFVSNSLWRFLVRVQSESEAGQAGHFGGIIWS